MELSELLSIYNDYLVRIDELRGLFDIDSKIKKLHELEEIMNALIFGLIDLNEEIIKEVNSLKTTL